MNKFKQNKKEKKQASGKAPRFFMEILNGTFLTRNNFIKRVPYLLFFGVLMLFYIGYGFYCERTYRDIVNAENQVEKLNSEYIVLKKQLQRQKSQSQVAAIIKEMGLEESTDPPIKIENEK